MEHSDFDLNYTGIGGIVVRIISCVFYVVIPAGQNAERVSESRVRQRLLPAGAGSITIRDFYYTHY